MYYAGEYRELIVRVIPALYRSAPKYGITNAEVEDVVQQCSAIMLHRIKNFDPTKGRFSTWAHWVLRSEAAKYKRANQAVYIPAHVRKKWPKVLNHVLDRPHIPSDNHWETRHRQREELIEYILRLPSPEQRCVWYYLHNIRMKVIGEKLQLTRQRIKQIIDYGLYLLRSMYAESAANGK